MMVGKRNGRQVSAGRLIIDDFLESAGVEIAQFKAVRELRRERRCAGERCCVNDCISGNVVDERLGIAGTFEDELSDVTRSYAGKEVVRYALRVLYNSRTSERAGLLISVDDRADSIISMRDARLKRMSASCDDLKLAPCRLDGERTKRRSEAGSPAPLPFGAKIGTRRIERLFRLACVVRGAQFIPMPQLLRGGFQRGLQQRRVNSSFRKCVQGPVRIGSNITVFDIDGLQRPTARM